MAEQTDCSEEGAVRLDGMCSPIECGDGRIDPTEICDDGNDIETDAADRNQNCSMGDGVVWDGEEDCDDGNESDQDACTTLASRPDVVMA